MINLIPLRYPVENIRTLLWTQSLYEDVFLIKDKSFERAEDFLEEAKRIITFIREDARPWIYQDFYHRTSACFAFFYQKIDESYMKESQKLQTLFEKEAWEENDRRKEKEIKLILRDLFKCEMAIEKLSQSNSGGYSPNLYSQLEILFDDFELLDLLLLTISNQLQDHCLDNQPLRLKALYFILPFLKLFYGGSGDIMDFCKDHQDFLKKLNAIEEVQREIEKLLGQYTDLNESEILRFCEEIKSTSEDRRLRQIITKEKKIFKEEKGYYEMLGNLSLFLYLQKQEAAGRERFMPLFRMGVVCSLYFLDGWRNIKVGFERHQFEYYWRFKSLNLKDDQDLPIKLMKEILNEVNQRDLNQEYLQLLELSLSAFGCFIKMVTILQYSRSNELYEGFKECIDSCLINSEGDKSFILHDFYEFLDSKMMNLSQIQSNYDIASFLHENLIYEWLEFYRVMGTWDFVGQQGENGWVYDDKYCSPAKILFKDLVELATSEKGYFLAVPEYLRAKMVEGCEQLFRDRNLLKKSDLEEVYFSAQDIGIAVLHDLKKGVQINNKAILRFRLLITLNRLLINIWKKFSLEDDLIKKIHESELIEEFIVAYEENQSLLQKAGDVHLTEAVWEFISFLSLYSNFVLKERNANFLKFVLQDSCEIDLRVVNKQFYYSFSSGIQALLRQAEFVKHLKDEKLLFGILRIYLFSPSLYSWESSEFAENLCRAFSEDLIQKRTFLHLFGKLLEVFENKMRDPSLDFYNALKQFENGIEDEKKNFQEEKVKEEDRKNQPYLADKEAPVINERTNISSLQRFAGIYCNRLSVFLDKIPSTFNLDLEKLNEQVESVTRRLARMMVDPLFLFASNPGHTKGLKGSIEGLSYTDQDVFLYVFEGVFTGIVDICKEFKFNEYSVISKLDAKRLCKMISKVSVIHSLRREDIPEDITYQEAALMSLIIGVKFFNKCLFMICNLPTKKLERLEAGLKEATICLDQVHKNILKSLSFEIANQDIEAFVKDCQTIFDERCFSLNLWGDILNLLYGTERFKRVAEETSKMIIERFDPSDLSPNNQEEKSILAGILYNSFRLKEVDPDNPPLPQNLWISMITSPEGLEPLLRFELGLFEFAHRYSKTKDLVKPLARDLEYCFNGRRILNNEDEIKKNCFEKGEKVVFRIIGDFLKQLAAKQVPQRDCKALMKKNLEAVFGFFGDFYKIYSNYTKEKVASTEIKIEEFKNEKTLLEKEKSTLIENYKNEIQKYIDAVVQCQEHHFVNWKELFALGEEFGGIIPHGYWIKLYESACGNLTLYVKSLLPDSKNKSINQIYQIDFLYQCLEQLFIKEIVDELSLDKDLIQDLLTATNKTLKSLTLDELTILVKERQCLDFPETVSGLISRVSKICINYIVCQVLKNNDDNNFLFICLDLIENVFASQQCILHGMRRDIFSGWNSTCYKDTVCLMNAVLRANKSLRVEFIKRNFLEKLLTVSGLSVMDNDEISSVLFLMITLLENTGPKNLSPVAEECLQVLLKSLIENYSFENTFMASFEKFKEKEKLKNIERLNKTRTLAKGFFFVAEKLQEGDEWRDESDVYWDKSENRQMIVKDTSALVVVLSGILSNIPHLIPFVVFQEVSVEDFLKEFQKDPDLMSFFKSNSRMSIFEILLRLVLLKDVSSGVFLIASLIENNIMISESIELKYLLLNKTFEILQDLLDSEGTQGKRLETLNSVLMRRNVAMILGFVSSKVNEDDNFSHKEEILQLIVQTTQKLFSNPQMIAYSMQDSQSNNSMIRILSSTVKQSFSKSMTPEEIKNNYADILEALKTRGSCESKVFQTNLKDVVFEKNIFIKKDQREDEILEKEETTRFLEIAGLKDKELISEVRLAAHGGAKIGADLTLNSIFSENVDLNGLRNLYKPLQSENDLRVDYLLDKLLESQVFGQIQKEIDQTFGGNINSEALLPLFKADLSNIEKLKKEPNQDAENLEELDSNQEIPKDTQEVLVEEDSSNPATLLEEEKIHQEDEAKLKYFVDITVKSEGNFKFRVNKALQRSKRLKEMICLEKTLKNSDEKSEEIISEFTSGMTEFDKNVVYASLGKKFEIGLSENLRNITEEARKELETIQKDFTQYEEAKNKIQKLAEESENKVEEDEEYEDLDYDIQFLDAEEEKPEDESNKEDTNEGETNELISEEGAPAKIENEKIVRLINTFEVGDAFIMDALELLFCYLNPNSGNQSLMIGFLKDVLSLNPVNELKILDVMITILYTPDFFKHLKMKLIDSYEKAVEIILSYILEDFEFASRSYVFFIPKGYLDNFGIALLKDLKEATNFAQKVSDCHTLLEMLLGLIETKGFSKNEKWSSQILDGTFSLLKNEKNIKLEENTPQVSWDCYRNVISCRKLLNVLNIVETETILKVQELFMHLKSIPELFVPFRDYLSKHFYQTILKLNKELENSRGFFKENQNKELETTKIHNILAPLNLYEFQLIMTIMFSFAGVFQKNLFTDEGKKSKASKKIRIFLQTVTESFFNEEEVKTFFVNIHELAESLNKVQQHDDFIGKLLDLLIMICVGHYSIIIMGSSSEESKTGSGLSDVEHTPSLARFVSYEEQNTHEMIPLQKSYSSYRKDINVDFGAIFANFALKHCSRISKITTSPMAGITTILSDLIMITIPKFPWILDFKSKMELFETKVDDQLMESYLDRDSRREIQIDRKNFVFSAMKEFKDRPIQDLLQFIQISYKNEAGSDGGGLRRDFYETITKQLFDPSVGLFRLDDNQISIQPNPFSGMIPYDSTLMQFAGLILAKAICDKMVVDLNFTKPFLKHILGKTITIGDMEGIDADLSKNLRWMLKNNVEELCFNYAHEIEVLGERKMIELKEGGSDLIVDEENKKEYVKQICEYRMTKQIKKQLKDFLKGFRMILPRDFISHFTTSELEILIAGESKIDLEEMKKYASLSNYSQSDQIIKWLWEVLEEFSPDQLNAFYYFVSGSTKVPFGGFKDHPIRIWNSINKDGLPLAHTCSYAIEIPNYDTKDKLREKLLIAIFDGVGEFQIA